MATSFPIITFTGPDKTGHITATNTQGFIVAHFRITTYKSSFEISHVAPHTSIPSAPFCQCTRSSWSGTMKLVVRGTEVKVDIADGTGGKDFVTPLGKWKWRKHYEGFKSGWELRDERKRVLAKADGIGRLIVLVPGDAGFMDLVLACWVTATSGGKSGLAKLGRVAGSVFGGNGGGGDGGGGDGGGGDAGGSG